jgi:Predicted membrane protein (DUF2306)
MSRWTSALQADWKIPLALLALSAIPCAAGIGRMAALSSSSSFNGDSERFLASPAPVVLHILGACLFCLLGAFQFSAGLRQRHPQWHKVSGWGVATSGAVAAITGVWMAIVYPIPAALQGNLLWGVRVLAGTSMLASIVLAVVAAVQRDLVRHRAWMIRGYALGQGAGTQVVVLLPWMLLMGTPSALQRDVLMSLAWLVNLLIAEMLIQGRPRGNVRFRKAIPM